MARRRLIWKLFPTYLVLILACCGAAGLWAWHEFYDFYLDQTAEHLAGRARLVRRQIAGPLAPGRVEELNRLCADLAADSGDRITVIRPDGEVLAESSRDPAGLRNHADRPEFQAALAGRTGRDVRHSVSLGQDMMYVAVPLERDGQVAAVVRLAVPLVQLRHAMAGLYAALLAGLALVAVLAALAAYLAARRLSRPLEEIRAGAERFARGELGHRLYLPATAEVAALAEALNQMAGQLDERIRAVAEQQGRQEAMLASMIEGVVAVDRGRRVLSINRAAAGLLGVGPPDAAGRELHVLVRNAELERLVGKVLDSGQPAEGELVLRPNGDERIVQATATLLGDARGQAIGALLVFNDVTRLRRLEVVRRDFVANVSHELKTPITSIKGFVETLRDGAIDDPERARQFLDILCRQADRLNAIIEDLLTLSRLEQEADKRQVPVRAGAIREVLDNAVSVCQLAARDRNVAVEVDCPAALAAPINAPLLEQAVVNLIDNAIKYSEPGQSVRVSAGLENSESGIRNAELKEKTLQAGQFQIPNSEFRIPGVWIRVEDRGCGIPAEHLPRLFERFYRVDKARSRKLGGTGLGLAIVKHIVAAHGGAVSVKSTPGQGSTFTILLPPR
jgi:two-component system, OmpR family, phosphate regulon sensor histidine kinase PhoR